MYAWMVHRRLTPWDQTLWCQTSWWGSELGCFMGSLNVVAPPAPAFGDFFFVALSDVTVPARPLGFVWRHGGRTQCDLQSAVQSLAIFETTLQFVEEELGLSQGLSSRILRRNPSPTWWWSASLVSTISKQLWNKASTAFFITSERKCAPPFLPKCLEYQCTSLR